ncbi:MAG: DNA primase [Cystobacterineae bacterium]|nr:DNA primase [Cystobacterineae bacterium]
MSISENKIAEIRERVDFLALVRRHGVELKKSGRSYVGLCPFHAEKTGSFHVWPEDERFKCFGCHASGDVFGFVQRISGQGFLEVLRLLAEECGVALNEGANAEHKQKAMQREATALAQAHFFSNLWENPKGHSAQTYLLERGVSKANAQDFGLGFALDDWTALSSLLRERGLLAFAEQAGLVAPSPRGQGFFDVFRNRLMFPIRTANGKTVGFGGRKLGGEGPKYLNSRESALYNKSELLYGLDRAREPMRKRQTAVLCEGYFDCLALHRAGFAHSVALCSTQLTPKQLAVLQKQEVRQLCLLLDGDAAGRDAVLRLAASLLISGFKVHVALLPDNEDPDTFLLAKGPEALTQLLSQAPPLSHFLLQFCFPNGRSASFEETLEGIQRIRPVLSKLPPSIERSAFLKAIAEYTQLPISELNTKLQPSGHPPPLASSLPQIPASTSTSAPALSPPQPQELRYVGIALAQPSLLNSPKAIPSCELEHLGLRAAVEALLQNQTPEEALSLLNHATQQALEHLLLPAETATLAQEFEYLSGELHLKAIERALTEIRKQSRELQEEGELSEQSQQLLTEYGRLLTMKQTVLRQRKFYGSQKSIEKVNEI